VVHHLPGANLQMQDEGSRPARRSRRRASGDRDHAVAVGVLADDAGPLSGPEGDRRVGIATGCGSATGRVVRLVFGA
jgi:hypothetical protein